MKTKGDIRRAAELGPVLNSCSRKKLSTPPCASDPKFIRQFGYLMALILLILVSAPQILTLEVSGVDVYPNNATTESDLYCSFNVSGQSEYNVTWYKNGVFYNSSINASNPVILSKTVTTKSEKWNCTVIAKNSTGQVMRNSDLVEILNAPPSTPYLINSSGQDIGDYEPLLEEGGPYSFTIISSDPDGDVVYYDLDHRGGDDYCTLATNIVTCNPTTQPDTAVNDRYRIVVDDGFIGSLMFVEFNVTPINDVPYLSPALGDWSMEENQTLQYQVLVQDEENPLGPFGFSIVSDYELFERLEYVTSNNQSFTIQFIGNRKANFSDRGNHTVNVTFCDPVNISLCNEDSFNLEVIPLNQPPQVGFIPNYSGVQGGNLTFYVNASDPDISDTVYFSIQSLNCYLANPWTISTLVSASNATGIVNVTGLTNSHIACRNITISATDQNGNTGSQNVYLQLNNTNDAPIIYNYSLDSQNTHNNIYILNLTAYTSTLFRYRINATDPDLWTDNNERLNYTINSSLCGSDCPFVDINSSGYVWLTASENESGNYYYSVNVTDYYGLSVSALLYLSIINNTPPYFNPPLQDQTAQEGVLFVYDIDAVDPQGNSYTFSDSSFLYNISPVTGVISFTPVCLNINVTVETISVTDSVGATTVDTFVLNITNTPDAPVLPLISNQSWLEEIPYYADIGLSTYDNDVNCSAYNSLVTDSLLYSSEFIQGSTLFTIHPTMGVINFTPNTSSDGIYIINISVIDSYNLSSSQVWSLTINNKSDSPIINNITPYGYPTVFNWTSTPSNNMTTINVSEDFTLVLDHNSTDPDNDDLVFNWSKDGQYIGNQRNQSIYFNYSDSGLHSIVLRVSDNVSGVLAHSVYFTWNTTVANKNREPDIIDPLPDIFVNGSVNIGNYFSGLGWSETRFYDPDNDTLTYTHTAVTIATISITGNSITVSGDQQGNQTVIFTATDPYGANISSNNVTIIVNEIEQEETTTVPTPTESTATRTVTIQTPYTIIQEIEKEKQVYFDILVPEAVTVYINDTIRQVIGIVNKGNTTLRGVLLSAEINSTDATINFSNNYFPELKPGQEEKTDMIITSYKLLNHYEVVIWANISDPKYNDKAVVYINAIEKTRGNESVANTKITFARDLLSSNPECIELNEYLKKAQTSIENGDFERASNIVDEVVQGCKFLVTNSKLRDESPKGWRLTIDLESDPWVKPVLVTFFVLMVVTTVLTIRSHRLNANKEEQ